MRIHIGTILALILLTPMTFAAPMVTNAGFEEPSAPNTITGWSWTSSAATTWSLSTEKAHSGKYSVKLTNNTPISPNVYGRLWQNVPVIPSAEYELSLWVAGNSVAQGSHLTDWGTYTLGIPEGSYGWRRISLRFTTKSSQTSLPIGFNLVNTCGALFVDDIALRPIGVPLNGHGVQTSLTVPSKFFTNGTPLSGAISYQVPADDVCRLTLVMRDPSGKTLSTQQSDIKGDGVLPIALSLPADTPARTILTVSLLSSNGAKINQISREISIISTSALNSDLAKLTSEASLFQNRLKLCQTKHIRCDYPLVTKTMVSQFLPFVKDDIMAGELTRAYENIGDIRFCIQRAQMELDQALAAPQSAPVVTRYKTSPITIKNGSFAATRVNSTGQKTIGPVFFTGYGHFTQLRKDLDKFPSYGVNIIQVEIGPMAVLTAENKVSYDSIKELQTLLDRAAKNNIAVNVLISPHYFPAWALKKWPHLTLGHGGFLGYTPDEPEAKQVQAKFLKILIPAIAKKPALHSICLSNEPVLDGVMGARNTPQLWHRYLQAKYGTIESYNTATGSHNESFESIPLPDMSKRLSAGYTEYCLFNQQRFAAWHQFLADQIHQIAPKIPVHAKLMNWTYQQRETAPWGNDPELFNRFSQINGNDCLFWPDADDQWCSQWGLQALSYDLQRSMKPVPVFNSENHITLDRSTNYVKPTHFRSVLWQGAVHGQGATTIWVWERSANKSGDFYGNVMDRPGCVDSVGRTALDLMRCADQVTALQRKPAEAAIVYSVASAIGNLDYIPSLNAVYQALLFSGMRVGFISDRQLSEGQGKQYKLIVLSNASRLASSAMTTLRRLPLSTTVLVIGDRPTQDQIGNPLPPTSAARSWRVIPNGKTADQLRDLLRPQLAKLQLLPDVQPMAVGSKNPVWGVEWLTASLGEKRYINMVNWTNNPVKLDLRRNGKAVKLRVLAPLNTSSTSLLPGLPILAEILD
ncbi:MAG: beta-galactosidase [Armatimonadota bacterium]